MAPVVILAATAGLAGGCRELQSVLAPQGPQARQVAELSWILFGGGALILALVAIITALAVAGSDPVRALLARSSSVIVGGLVVPVAVLSVLLAYGVWLTRSTTQLERHADAVAIEVTGEQWWWRVVYTAQGGERITTANEIRIPVGRPIDFTLRSTDVIHSFWVPNLGGKVDMIPGRTTRLRLTADHTGVFRGQCAEFCGGPHGLMAFEVVALTPDAFAAWLDAQAADAREPSSPPGRRGLQLFLAAGCGGCHAVRGTSAAGVIGPDLTHLGSRLRIGAATLPMSPDAVARFIVDGQHIKPGNRMPPFRLLDDDSARMIALYLLEGR